MILGMLGVDGCVEGCPVWPFSKHDERVVRAKPVNGPIDPFAGNEASH